MKKSSKSQNNDENYIETKRQINKMSEQLHQEDEIRVLKEDCVAINLKKLISFFQKC